MDGGNREEEGLCWDPGLPVASSPSSHSHRDVPTGATQFSLVAPTLPQRQYDHYDDPSLYASPLERYPDRYSPDETQRLPDLDFHHHDLFYDPSAPSHAADNFQAVASNAALDAPGGSPDDFYRRGYQNDFAAKHNLVPDLTHDSMASAVSTNRQAPPSRSTSNGNSSKLPAAPASRASTRPMHRSASNPVDDRFAPTGPEGTRLRSATGSAVPAAPRASVKDMTKRFEQNGPRPPSAEPRRTASRSAVRDGKAAVTNGRSTTAGPAQSYSSLRTASTASAKSTPATNTQRSRFVPEDQISTNSQSFASRINRPKANSTPKPTTKSLTSIHKQTSSPPTGSGGPLLFGEIREGDLDAATPGYGIEDDQTRRLSEPVAQDSSTQHQRSQSDAVAEPASPTDWYRGASPPQKNRTQSSTTSPAKNHSRSQSDLAMSRLPPINTNSQVRKRREQSPSPHSSASRLPVLNKKFGAPSNPASPASSRSNSPAGVRRVPPSGRTSRQQTTPTTRSKTPVTRSKTPTGSSAARRTPVQNPSSSRLATVISPPPRLSPPLRSSRPRQPVSQATTASSRSRAVGGSKSPQKSGVKPSAARPDSRQETPAERRRKLSLGGPVDFAQRRETIKLKYSKSIRETEAKQVREAAAEKRKKELEAAAKAKARAQARAEAQIAAAGAAATTQSRDQAHPAASLAGKEPSAARKAEPTTEETAAVATEEASSAVRVTPPSLTIDSPTLGLPGTFPSFGSPPLDRDEAPPSAISETSVVTEFDHEAQTEPPVPEQPAQTAVPEELTDVDHAQAPDLHAPQLSPVYEKATYRDPFEDIPDEEDTIPIKISFEPTLRPTSPSSPAWVTSHAELPIPGAFRDEQDTLSMSECESQHFSEPQPETQPEAPPEAPEPPPEVEVQAEESAVEPDTEPQTEARDEYEQPDTEPQIEARDEYEPQPYIAQPYHTTTVTIISRDVGFGSPTYVKQETAEPAQPQTEAQIDTLEDFYTGPRLKDNIASLRDSTFTASDADTSDGPSGTGEAQRTPDTSNSLNVPSMTTPANRSSQQSIWTDLSYSSRDSRRLDYLDPSDLDGSRPQSVRDDDSSFRHRYFVDVAGRVVDEETRAAEYHGGYRSPDLDARGVFAGSYASLVNRSPHVPKLPDHAPPPPPDAGSRPTSDYYDDHRPSSSATRDDQGSISFPVSRRDSDDFHNASTPHSLNSETPAHTPFEGENDMKLPEDVDEESVPAKKEKSRLRQRQLCIKELVDTEAVFVRDMNVVEEIYKGTAEACPKLDDKTIKLIFRNTNEIIAFHTTFLSELKEGVTSVYTPRGRRSPMLREDTTMSDANTVHSMASIAVSTAPSNAPSSTTAVSLSGTTAPNGETEDSKDRQTVIGPAFIKSIEQMRAAHEGFLRTSDVANKRLIEIQQDPTVQVWLNECNEVARDLTAAWNLDSLLIKPMQRITKYPNLIAQLLQYTPEDHPDREGLMAARVSVENAILEINKTKKNFELVGQIVGRKRKESDVKAGFARAFGKRVDKLQTSSKSEPEDPEYMRLNEKFSDDYLRLQVVLRDVEFYTRQVAAYVQTFLDYLSAMELVMRLQPGPHPELEAKWVQFNVSMRDIKTVALDQHVRPHMTLDGILFMSANKTNSFPQFENM